jgi:AcrR family transcriptional regulator
MGNNLATTPKAAGTPPPGRRERKRAETREKLFQAALRLFTDRGFAATTVEDITEAADVGKGTFFNYFPTKEHLLQYFGERQVMRIDDWLHSVKDSKRPARQLLQQLLATVSEVPAGHPEIIQAMVATFVAQQEIRDGLKDKLAKGRSKLAEFFRTMQDRGEVRQDIEPQALARAFQQAAFGTLLLWSLHVDTPLSDYLEPTFQVMWGGMRPKPARPGK